jgi:SAM domain (Sterile alpha motif)
MAMMMIAAMQQIADWLGKLGLGQYAQRFAENDIDFSILADLNDQDLKALGVSSLGHRRQLLLAIAAPRTSHVRSFRNFQCRAVWSHSATNVFVY